ncbi:response regulator transcription factor [Kineosporia sp. R_H_3]|uniref:response regulator n=1 Tax=Kineosporia sp. R_H_3 TaxID=1961848 RepID=UPI000B4B6DF8|nr:response regulator transcription factor [Kineosporia sp. R_H_3]
MPVVEKPVPARTAHPGPGPGRAAAPARTDVAADLRWRVVLADDHSMVRVGLRALLEGDPRCAVVGEAASAAALRALVATQVPDLVVLDLTLGRDNGLDCLPDLLAAPAAPRVVVLTMHDDPAVARAALHAGAQGYVLKEAAPEELLRAVETVMSGRTYLLPELGARIAGARPSAADRLSPRERDVLRLLAAGHTNGEIAAELYVSLRTVEAHRASLRTRLDAPTRAGLVDAAHRLGLA